MRYLSFAVLASAIVCGYSNEVAGDRVRDLIDSALTFYRTGAIYFDPLSITGICKTIDFRHIINGQVTMKNNTFYGIQNVAVDSESTNPASTIETAELHIRFPNITFESDYEYNGTLIGHRASGKGQLKYSILNLTVAMDKLTFGEYDKYGTGKLSVELKSLGLSFDVQNIEFHIEGLDVSNLPLQLFEKAFAAETKLLFKLMKFPLHFAAERKAIEFANMFIAGRSMEELTIWLKDNQYYCQKHGC